MTTEDPSAERDLMSAMLAGEQRAFTTFFDSHWPAAMRVTFWGALAMASTAAIGALFGVTV